MIKHPLQFFAKQELEAREQQKQVLDAIHVNWGKYNYFALSLPTGVGKTYIATSIADSVGNSAYILTSTLQLQTQYEKSWAELVNLKGRSNYQCNLNKNFTVDAAPCSANKELIRGCITGQICAYYNQKQKALQSRAMITNPVYMLYSTHCGFAKDGEEEGDNPWTKRDVLIIDEAHNLENHLIQFAESDVDPEQIYLDFGIDTSRYKFTGEVGNDYQLVVELKEELERHATILQNKLADEFPSAALLGMDPRAWARGLTKKVAEKVQRLNNKMYKLDKALQPLKIFFNTHGDAQELARRWLISKLDGKNILKLAPIYGDFLFHEYLGKLADKFIFLSATLGSKQAFSRELGLTEKEIFYMETDSPFSPAKSPIIVMPAIKLSREVYQENVKKIGPLLDEILSVHPNERGIIHCVTYDLGKEIFSQLKGEHRNRLLFRDMVDMRVDLAVRASDQPGRTRLTNEELLRKHETEGRKISSVLLSPSMMEGVDLYDDLSRFQVIVKLPWGFLGDPRVKTKSGLDPSWYANKMWLSVMQASGRSTRNEEDSSVTYILDANFKYFYDQWRHSLPNWFKRRLVF